MTRRRTATTVALVLALLIASVAPVMAAGSLSATDAPLVGGDALTEAALDRPDEAIQYGVGPGWAVKVEDSDATASLEEWANASDDRRLIERNNASNWSVVAAPASEIGISLTDRVLGTPLSERDYVAAIEPEMGMERPEPASLPTESEIDFAELPLRQSLLSEGSLESVPDGVAARNETEPTDMAANRDITGVDNVSTTGDGVTVAVVDTGANTLNGRVFGNSSAGSDIRIDAASKSFISGESVDAATGDYSAVSDGSGHGTHVASTIAANTTDPAFDGVAPDANLLVLKALEDDGSGSSADIAAAIRYAADQNADVLSLSLGSPAYSQQIAEAVRYARDEGTVVAIAAGNSRQTVRWVSSPADTPTDGVVTVGAANVSTGNGTDATVPGFFSQLGPDPGTTDFSAGVTTGEGVDIAAPGTEITAATPTEAGTRRNTTLSGTSMATPHVSGVAALLIADDGSLSDSPNEAATRLTETARTMPKASQAAVGHGYLAADRALSNTTDQSQADARNADAKARDIAWRSLSNSRGGLLAGIGRSLASAAPEV